MKDALELCRAAICQGLEGPEGPVGPRKGLRKVLGVSKSDLAIPLSKIIIEL